jgi:hypothetical protein
LISPFLINLTYLLNAAFIMFAFYQFHDFHSRGMAILKSFFATIFGILTYFAVCVFISMVIMFTFDLFK